LKGKICNEEKTRKTVAQDRAFVGANRTTTSS
jgi:hypothetical protein